MGNEQQARLGRVLDTTGDRVVCRLDREVLGRARGAEAEGDLAAASIGGLCKIAVGPLLLVASLGALREDRSDPAFVLAELEYVGEGMADAAGRLVDFRRGISAYPHPGDRVDLAEPEDFRRIFAPPDVPHVTIGTVFPTQDVRAPLLFDRLLGRHFAVVGSTGAGKSTLVTLVLQRVAELAPHGHILVLDPHGEYAHAFGDAAQVWDVGNLRLPYWAMNLEEHCEAFILPSDAGRGAEADIMAKCLQKARARNVRIADSARITADSPVPYLLKDLIGAIDEEAGRLEKLADAHAYTQLRLRLEQFFSDSRYGFIFNTDLAGHSLEAFLGEMLRVPGEGRPISIIDLAGVPTEVVNVVVSTLARLTLDFAIRASRRQSMPILLLCEEAHRYLPHDHSAVTAGVEHQLERIAREGRKYGVCLGLVTQRPSELSETALSQCGTIISLRLNNPEDQARLRACLTEGARAHIDIVPALKNQECPISGEGTPVPMRVRIDTLEAARRPASDDPTFSAAWRGDAGQEKLVRDVVGRWREGS
ncbi:ATP-binding protein [Novosphingobium sp.]|uniref:ATP-binding protein n=1 Tax=Novosphingobium sp. TaxID=1874826 RepID=UPI002B467727|nr:DUF87 domain-containing protein [Novosphingobium sp.]HKR91190.1 DUF87 domain-containing protein [Novosphingobium sp.]